MEGRQFFEAIRDVDLVAEITIQPLIRYKLDAAIIFTDILVIPVAMGMAARLVPGKGPVFDEPIREPSQMAKLNLHPDVAIELGFVMSALSRTRSLMDSLGFREECLIGFCGGPWTLFAYMIEGGPSSEWPNAKRWIYQHRERTGELLDALSAVCIEYLVQQVDAGAQALQVFDSHAGALPPDVYASVCWPPMARIASALKRLRPSVTLVGFSKGNHWGLDCVAKSDFDIAACDFGWVPAEARLAAKGKALMGNLDPAALHTPHASDMELLVHAMLDGLAPTGRGVVANLGHGVGISTPPSAVGSFVDAVRSWRGRETVVIGTRKSQLAMVQTLWVQKELREARPESEYCIEQIVSTGDKIQNVPLSAIGDTGLFTKQLEMELLSGRVDLAVHSLKDVETRLPSGLTLCAISRREDPCDILVPNPTRPHIMKCKTIAELPPGAVVGTSSVRRQAQIQLMRQDLVIKSVRGNVQTRLAKLINIDDVAGEDGGYDCLVMAKAGFERLGYLEEGPDKVLVYDISPKEMLHAVGQGALACECRTADTQIFNLVEQVVGDPETLARVTAERSFLRSVGGGCQVPLGVFTSVSPGGILYIEGGVFAPDGSHAVRAKAEGPAQEAEAIGVRLAERIQAEGGAGLMAAIARG